MKKLLVILLVSLVLNTNAQSEEIVQANVKSIEQFRYDIVNRDGEEVIIGDAYAYREKRFYSKQQKLLKVLTAYGKEEYSLWKRYTYNNSKLDTIYFIYNNMISSYRIFTYYNNGLVKMKKNLGINTTDINDETYFFYNDKNELIEKRSFIEVNGSRVVGRLMPVYDKELGFYYSPDRATKHKITLKNGLIVREEGVENPIVKTFTYDKYGNLLKSIQVTNYNDEESIKSETYTYKYDNKGNWIERKEVSSYQGYEEYYLVKRTIEYY
jgi:hypothetical protein